MSLKSLKILLAAAACFVGSAHAEEPLMPPPPSAELAAAFPNAPAVLPCGTTPEGMACIPGGPFLRGSNDGPDMAKPQAPVWAQTFFMDVNEVTFAQYKACERKGKCDKAGPKYRDFDRPNQPINGVSWYDAVKFCAAQGKHLPTEAQWEKAARGTDGRTHPWGNEPSTCERAVIMDETGRSCGVKKKGSEPDKGRVFEVGLKPAYLYGLKDIVGNSYEWVADWYSHSWAECGEACLGIDPKGPCEGKEPCKGHRRKVVRGGSWYWGPDHNNSVYRREHIPANNPEYHHFGFRCAASVEEAAKIVEKSAK